MKRETREVNGTASHSADVSFLYAQDRATFGSSDNVTLGGKIRAFYERRVRLLTIFALACILSVSGVLIAKISTDYSGSNGIHFVDEQLMQEQILTKEYKDFKNTIQQSRLQDKLDTRVRSVQEQDSLSRYDDSFFASLYNMLDDKATLDYISDFLMSGFGDYEAAILKNNFELLEHQGYIDSEDMTLSELLRGRCVLGVKFSISLPVLGGAIWGISAKLAVLTSGIFTTGGLIGTIVGFATGALVGMAVENLLKAAFDKFGVNYANIIFFEHNFMDTNIWLISFSIIVNITNILLALAAK